MLTFLQEKTSNKKCDYKDISFNIIQMIKFLVIKTFK